MKVFATFFLIFLLALGLFAFSSFFTGQFILDLFSTPSDVEGQSAPLEEGFGSSTQQGDEIISSPTPTFDLPYCTSPHKLAEGFSPSIHGRYVVFTQFDSNRKHKVSMYDLGPNHTGGDTDDVGMVALQLQRKQGETHSNPIVFGNNLVFVKNSTNGTSEAMIYNAGVDGFFGKNPITNRIDDVGPISLGSARFREVYLHGNIVTFGLNSWCDATNVNSGCFTKQIQTLKNPITIGTPRGFFGTGTSKTQFFIFENVFRNKGILHYVILPTNQQGQIPLQTNSQYGEVFGEFLSESLLLFDRPVFNIFSTVHLGHMGSSLALQLGTRLWPTSTKATNRKGAYDEQFTAFTDPKRLVAYDLTNNQEIRVDGASLHYDVDDNTFIYEKEGYLVTSECYIP